MSLTVDEHEEESETIRGPLNACYAKPQKYRESLSLRQSVCLVSQSHGGW